MFTINALKLKIKTTLLNNGLKIIHNFSLVKS